MVHRWNGYRLLLAALMCLTVHSGAFAEHINISWQTTDKTVANDGENSTREGTATFPNGERARIISHILHNFGPGSGTAGGTAYGTMVYKFDDGSGYELRYVAIWNSIIIRTAGLFGEGTGRFKGITGGANGSGDFPGAGLGTVAWTGSYDLPMKP